MKKLIYYVMALMFCAVVINACDENDNDDDDQNSTSNYKQALITHHGFDFSAGVWDTTSWPNNSNDGEIINWNPNYNDTTYPAMDIYVWFRNESLDTVTYKNQYKDMGVVDIATILSFSSSWDTTFIPLMPGHVIVAKCRDGYVKFSVTSADTSNFWSANVRYLYSATASWTE